MQAQAVIRNHQFQEVSQSDISKIRQAGFGIISVTSESQEIIIEGKAKKIKRFCRRYSFQILEITLFEFDIPVEIKEDSEDGKYYQEDDGFSF